MIPTWPGAMDAAMASLRPGGTLLIVDFWDQKDLPRVFAAGLKKWLASKREGLGLVYDLSEKGARVMSEAAVNQGDQIALHGGCRKPLIP